MAAKPLLRVTSMTIPMNVSLPGGESEHEEAKTAVLPTMANLYHLQYEQKAEVKTLNTEEQYGVLKYTLHKDLYEKGVETDDGIFKSDFSVFGQHILSNSDKSFSKISFQSPAHSPNLRSWRIIFRPFGCRTADGFEQG